MRIGNEQELSEETVAERMYRLRALAGLTQEELCDRIGYTANYYGQAERGAIPLSKKLAESLRTFYNTTYEYLYYGAKTDRVAEQSEYRSKNKMYHFLDECTEQECEMLYQIARVVIRQVRDTRDCEEENQ